jgi:hypothetical protein
MSGQKGDTGTKATEFEPKEHSIWNSAKQIGSDSLDLATVALHSAAYSGLQQPLTAVAQIGDQLKPSLNIEAKVQFISAPRKANFGDATWHAEQIGSAVGQLLPFLLARKVVGGTVGKFLSSSGEGVEDAALALRRAPIGMSTAEAAAAGFVNGALFTPNSDNKHFLSERFISAGSGAATMATLTATSAGLGRLANTDFIKSAGLSKVLRNPISSGIISGAPAGLVSAEIGSTTSSGRLASSRELKQSMYTMSMVGFALGSVGAVGSRAKGQTNEMMSSMETSARSTVSQPAETTKTGASTSEVATQDKAATPNKPDRPDKAPTIASDKITEPARREAIQDALKISQPEQLSIDFGHWEEPATRLPERPPQPESSEKPTETNANTNRNASEPEQLSLKFPEPLTPTGEKAFEMLKALERIPKGEAAQQHAPITLKEAQALLILLDEWPDGAQYMYRRLSERSAVARSMAYDSWVESSLDKIAKDYPKILEQGLLNGHESNQRRTNDYIGLARDAETVGITTADEAGKFLALFRRSKPVNNWIGWSGNPHEKGLFKLSQWTRVDEISDDAITPIANHIAFTGEPSLDAQTDVGALLSAAEGWRVAPQLPSDLATEVAEMPLIQRVAAMGALAKTYSQMDIAKADRSKLFYGDRAKEAERLFRQNLADVDLSKTRLILKDAPRSEALPLVVEQLYGDGTMLNAQERAALTAGLSMFNKPLKILATMDIPTFKNAYEGLLEKYPHEKDNLSEVFYGWQERAAVALATVFKSNWRNWLDSQQRLDRSAFESTRMIWAEPPADSKGLGAMLLENKARSLKHLETVAFKWSDIEGKEGKSFDEVLNMALLTRYKTINDPAFAREAAQWDVKKDSYEAMERRYIASKSVPSPFPLERSWSAQGLTGRFIPRDDPRGLFVGEYTNCCQHPGGNADSSAWYGQENPQSGFFIVENANKEIIAQSWAIATDGGGLLFDNVEAKGLGPKQDAVMSIYKQAADSLLSKFNAVTLGTANSDLKLDTLPDAGDLKQSLPTNFSGYTDAGQQVLLSAREVANSGQATAESQANSETGETATLPAVAPPGVVPESIGAQDRPTVVPPNDVVQLKQSSAGSESGIRMRGALSLDKREMLKIAQERFPDGWNYLPWEPLTRGLVVEDSDGRLQGYTLFEPSERYVSDLAVRKDAKAYYGARLTTGLFKVMRDLGGDWSADLRESTSYRIVKKAGDKGRLKIISDEVTDSPMNDEPMHHVVFSIPDGKKSNEATLPE